MEHGSFVGWTGDDVLHSLYRIADLCVVPSLYEPFGLVALEAMASGCPCIVADTGGPARGRAGRPPRRPALPRPRPALARPHGRAAAQRRRAARPAGGRGGGVGAALRLGRRRRARPPRSTPTCAAPASRRPRPPRRARRCRRRATPIRAPCRPIRAPSPQAAPASAPASSNAGSASAITAQSPTSTPAPTSIPASATRTHARRRRADPHAPPAPRSGSPRRAAAVLEDHAPPRATRPARRASCTLRARERAPRPAVERSGRRHRANVNTAHRRGNASRVDLSPDRRRRSLAERVLGRAVLVVAARSASGRANARSLTAVQRRLRAVARRDRHRSRPWTTSGEPCARDRAPCRPSEPWRSSTSRRRSVERDDRGRARQVVAGTAAGSRPRRRGRSAPPRGDGRTRRGSPRISQCAASACPETVLDVFAEVMNSRSSPVRSSISPTRSLDRQRVAGRDQLRRADPCRRPPSGARARARRPGRGSRSGRAP